MFCRPGYGVTLSELGSPGSYLRLAWQPWADGRRKQPFGQVCVLGPRRVAGPRTKLQRHSWQATCRQRLNAVLGPSTDSTESPWQSINAMAQSGVQHRAACKEPIEL